MLSQEQRAGGVRGGLLGDRMGSLCMGLLRFSRVALEQSISDRSNSQFVRNFLASVALLSCTGSVFKAMGAEAL